MSAIHLHLFFAANTLFDGSSLSRNTESLEFKNNGCKKQPVPFIYIAGRFIMLI